MRLFNYIMIMSALMILFYLAGINTSAGFVLGTLGLAENPESLLTDQSSIAGITTSNGNLYTIILLILGSVALAGVTIGFLTKSSPEIYLIAPLAVFLMTFMGDIVFLITAIKATCGDASSSCNWVAWIVIFITVPLMIGFLLSVIDWWRGKD